MTADSGPLQFIAGTGNIGAIGLDSHHYEATSEQLSDLPFDPSNAVTIDARAGDVVFFGPYAIHASFEIPRVSTVESSLTATPTLARTSDSIRVMVPVV